MKLLPLFATRYFLSTALFLNICWPVKSSGQLKYDKVLPLATDSMYSIETGKTWIKGFLGSRIDRCIENRIVKQDANYLIEPFKSRQETKFWQSEFWGKWILSAINAYKYSPSPELKLKIEDAVSGLISTQSKDGYIGNYAQNAHLKGWDIWGRKYCLLGLLACHELFKDPKVLKSAEKMADHFLKEMDSAGISIVKTGAYRGMPSSSILEPMILLYNRTGKSKYLGFARYIIDEWETNDGPRLISKALSGVPVAARFPDPPKWWSWDNGQKAYEMMACYDGLLEMYRITKKTELLKAVEMTVKNIIDTELNIAGGGSAYECWFQGKDKQTIPAYHMMESCVTQTWIKLCTNLLKITGKPIYADQIERTYYNALLASMTPDGSSFAKYSTLEGNRGLGEDQCGMHINCCIANAPRAVMQLPDVYMMTNKNTIYINMYNEGGASFMLEKNNTIKILQNTTYPQNGSIAITVNPEKEAWFSVCLRIPGWSTLNAVNVNGQEIPNIKSGAFTNIQRTWKKGDQILLTLDMRGRLHHQNEHIAVTRGPVVMALDSRLNKRFIDEAGVPKLNDGFLELTPYPAPAGTNNWLSFSAPFLMGTNLEINEGVVPMVFCDYASAANTWNSSSRFKVWIQQPLNAMKIPYKPY